MPFLTECFGPRTALAGLVGHELPDHKPVEEHSEPGQMELDRGRRNPELQVVDAGGDVNRLDVAQMGNAMHVAPGGEAGRGLRVGLAGVRVPDMGGEELDDASGVAGIGRIERREPARGGPHRRQRRGRMEGSRKVFGGFRGHFI